MHVFEMLLRTILGVPLFFYLPGYLADRAWLDDRSTVRGIERHAVRIVASVLLTGWLALVLAEIGSFSYWLLAAILGLLCMSLVYVLRGQGRLPRTHAGPHGALGIVAGQRSHAESESLQSWLAALRFDHVLLGIAVVFALLVARPFEVVRGGLDAGVYANTGIAIARTGSIVQHDPIVAEIGQRIAQGDSRADQVASNTFGVQPKNRFLASRLRAAGFFINQGEMAEGRVVPQFFHLWPTWIAVFVTMLGPVAGLSATGGAGLLSVVVLGLIGRRIGGPLVGLLAAAFLALMTPQVWFSRMPVAEALTQALLLAGLWAWMHFADAAAERERVWWGVLVGGAFGAVALTRFDFPFALAPVMLLLLYVALTRRWHVGYTAFAVTLSGLLLHTALHIIFISRAYFFDTAYHRLQDYAITLRLSLPFLPRDLAEGFATRAGTVYTNPWRLVLELSLVGGLMLGLLVASRRPGPLLAVERLIRQRQAVLLSSVVVLLGALAVYGYVIRPGILTADVLGHPLRADNWLKLQGYVGAPIAVPTGYEKQTRAVDLANMVRLGWYLSPLGVVLGVVGGLMLWRRMDRRTWLLIVIATAYTLLFVRALYGTSDRTYIYILRRYVPVVYPAFALGIAVALAKLRGTGDSWRLARTTLAALATLSLLLFFVATGRTAYAHVEYEGTLAQIAELDRHFGERDVILVRGGGRDTPELVATPLTYIFGRNALPVKGDQPAKYADAFADQVTRWRNDGRRVFTLLGANGGDLIFPGYTSRSVSTWTIQSREFQQLPNQKPKLSYTNERMFHLYELVPAESEALPLQLTYDDTAAQVTGFYPSEQPRPDQERAAWTNGFAVLRLPSSAGNRTLRLQVAGGVRPQTMGAAQMCVDVATEPVPYPEGGIATSLPWQELTCAILPERSTDVVVQLPALSPDAAVLVRLRSEPWTPASVAPDAGQPASVDERRLGVRFVRATLEP